MPGKTKKLPRKNHTPARKNKSGLGLIFWGALLIFIFAVYRIYSLKRLSFGNPAAGFIASGNRPTSINIPKVYLNLPITEANITDGTWEISPDGASHWNNSANPGEAGNIIIYAHNKTNLFGPIRWLSLGEKIIITDSNGSQHHYQITEITTVSPDQIDYIQPKNEETLTLYTCAGWWDNQRYLVVAKPAAD